MSKKSIFFGAVSVVLFSVLFGYSLVFGVNLDNSISVSFKISNNVYPDSLSLRNTKIALKSKRDLTNYTITSKCNVFSKLATNKEDIYLYDLVFLDNNCSEKDLYLENEKKEKVFKFRFNVVSEFMLYNEFIDYETSKLEKIKKLLDEKKLSLLEYDEYDENKDVLYNDFLKKNRLLNEVIYNSNLIKTILDSRNKKYLIPLKGSKLPTRSSKIPNSGRGYRSDYTDGIHHAWDFDGDFGEQVLAIDDGIIVRVVSEFDFSDLTKIKKGNNVTTDDKIKNLDILRGKQVWLKTMKGDVAFYSHLNDIFTNIEEGVIVRKGQPIGTIGISGVPDKNYNDYHLHLPINKNPHNIKKGGKYGLEDYMNWDWYFKGKEQKYILENQGNIFEK